MGELKARHVVDVYDNYAEHPCEDYSQVYLKSEVDKVIAELKCKSLDVKDVAHVLKAYKFYLCQLTHCAFDEPTAQWIVDNWEQDYERVEACKV